MKLRKRTITIAEAMGDDRGVSAIEYSLIAAATGLVFVIVSGQFNASLTSLYQVIMGAFS